MNFDLFQMIGEKWRQRQEEKQQPKERQERDEKERKEKPIQEWRLKKHMALGEKRKALEEKKKALEERLKAFEEETKALEEKRKLLKEKQKALEEETKAKAAEEEKKKALEEKKKAFEARLKALESRKLESEQFNPKHFNLKQPDEKPGKIGRPYQKKISQDIEKTAWEIEKIDREIMGTTRKARQTVLVLPKQEKIKREIDGINQENRKITEEHRIINQETGRKPVRAKRKPVESIGFQYLQACTCITKNGKISPTLQDPPSHQITVTADLSKDFDDNLAFAYQKIIDALKENVLKTEKKWEPPTPGEKEKFIKEKIQPVLIQTYCEEIKDMNKSIKELNASLGKIGFGLVEGYIPITLKLKPSESGKTSFTPMETTVNIAFKDFEDCKMTSACHKLINAKKALVTKAGEKWEYPTPEEREKIIKDLLRLYFEYMNLVCKEIKKLDVPLKKAGQSLNALSNIVNLYGYIWYEWSSRTARNDIW